jgi:hypothetical protein
MNLQVRNTLISIFVVIWLVVFYYESTCFYYLQPLSQHALPRLKFLFPPAGWIMFYNVGDNFGYAEVYGFKDGEPQLIDPHDILRTRAIGYDNINRNALVTVLTPGMAASFCPYLRRRFPYFDKFAVTYVEYPHLVEAPFEKRQSVAYECNE